ncbi:serine/threonine-protein kinase [Neorhodopirellula pilleata]|uniref:Serine/threonine-protein kinase PknA n=1 Tax=Neorhodopirellula pilleata TaxID=2714738 RepID=A0A5C6AVN7_9BACT|nr:serine/threonine-protein kinase [Neorhodopirellula pilleata]TWU03112.1 Serine/threonine-protein kinase PknA [Neorhodopirellula pilleata]
MSEFEYLGPYRIGNVIGRGGMGSVYEATHAKSGEVVAVKLIAQHVADDERFRRRFNGEIETLRRLRHPGIVRLIGYGEEAGRLFYSMELVHGESLQQRIREVKRMGWLPTVDIAIQVCSALKHAHDIGAIHRDLKPANLILTPANEVKLVDFGITKLFGYGEQTMAGSVLGTADYMAPEQADGGPVTPRTDLYALGSVMYAMMAGRSPFAGKKLTQVIESLKNERAVPLELINPDIPHEVVEIVHHLLEKDPKRRPPTALSVMKRLKATRAGLQRGRTVALESELTRGGDLLGPSEPPTPESDTHHSHLTDAGKVGGGGVQSPNSDTSTENRRHAENGSRVHSKKPSGNVSDESIGDDPLIIQGDPDFTNEALPPTRSSEMETSAGETDFVTGHPETPKTRFQSIDSDEQASTFLGRLDTPHSSTHVWVQWASVAAMVAILGGGVYLFARAVATPTADELFASIEAAEADGNLTLHENQIERFLIHYAQDDRIEQVRRWESQADLERTLKRIAAAARRAGGIERLEPATQSFYKAMAMRESSIDAARTQLIAWLNVFAPRSGPGELDDANNLVEENAKPPAGSTPVDELRRRMRDRETGRLAELAREELERLVQSDASPSRLDERLIALRERLAVAESLPKDAKERMILSLIQLYLDEPWAAPVIQQAKGMLP